MDVVAERLGRLLGPVGDEPSMEHVGAGAEGPMIFRREGDYWLIAYEGARCRLRHARGLELLARLMADPGREFHALDLARADTAGGRAAGVTRELDSRVVLGDAGPVLDAAAKAAYKARLAELEGEIEEAERLTDTERRTRVIAERDALVTELSRAVGLGGRDRRAASAAERARVSTTRSIRSAMARISAGSPALGSHLQRTIHTGTFCAYLPDPRAPVDWQL
jgi:hypothetical protein